MKYTAKLRRLRSIQAKYVRLRTQALADLPEQYGFRSVDAFLQAVRKARRSRVEAFRRRLAYRFSSSRLFRRKVAELFAQGKTPVGIAVEMGVSLRDVDRVIITLERRNRSKQAKLRPRKSTRRGSSRKS